MCFHSKTLPHFYHMIIEITPVMHTVFSCLSMLLYILLYCFHVFETAFSICCTQAQQQDIRDTCGFEDFGKISYFICFLFIVLWTQTPYCDIHYIIEKNVSEKTLLAHM